MYASVFNEFLVLLYTQQQLGYKFFCKPSKGNIVNMSDEILRY